jgi:pyridoxal phosphate enzyme (YggS family)
MIEVETVVDNASRVRDRIAAAGGDPDAVTLVAVTKGFGPEVARLALAAGLGPLGENYAQELQAKAAAFAEDPPPVPPVWHFLGNLQTNKVRHLAPLVACWQSVDRPALVTELAKRAPGAAVLVQINLSGEPHKGGCTFEDAPALVGLARDAGLAVQGLMGVGPAGEPAAAEPGFRRLVALADTAELPVRSIGMSADLEVAVRAGSTMVRVGRDLFGPRPAARR